jgi:3-hydroxyisobutyrate dehydrogenase-like beta-hydroxyacid dehydrogenase
MSDSNRRSETIAIVGAGEMGAAVGQRMRETGARVLTSLKGRSPASVERVRRAQLEVIDDDDALMREAGFILSIVPPGEAIAVGERFRAPLSRARQKPAFVECNAVSPATVRRIADSLATTGVPFIDAGIIGGPPPAGRVDRGPRFYASGPNAHLLNHLRTYGLDIAIVDGPVGAASALKMSYAGLTKGMIAVGAAMIGGAARDGLGAALHAELARSQPELLAMFARRIPAMFPKAYRWVAEMEQIAEFLGAPGDGATIYTGAARFYDRVAEEWEHDGDAGSAHTALKSFLGATDKR